MWAIAANQSRFFFRSVTPWSISTLRESISEMKIIFDVLFWRLNVYSSCKNISASPQNEIISGGDWDDAIACVSIHRNKTRP